MPHQYIKKILASRVYEAAVETPLDEATNLSARLQNRVLLKREDLQPVFSFKIRGAYNKLAQLSDDERARGVICASAGNHAQGLAMAASVMGVKAVIVMPRPTPEIKVNAVKARGGQVVLHGDTFDEALAYALQQVDEKGYVFVHPYDDPYTIAGQGTIGMEILRQESGPIHSIFIPVGGGGLAAGIAVYIKYLYPDVRVIAVESEESACLKAAMDAGERVKLPQVGIFADGIAVAQIGEHTFDLCRKYVDEVITVSTDEICAAIKDVFTDTRSIPEPAGAASIAGMKKYVERENIEGETLIGIVSGANMNFSRLRYVAERTDLGEKTEALLAVKLPERPGSFREFCLTLGKRAVTEFNYRYADSNTAHVFAGISLGKHGEGKEELLQNLREKDFEVVDLSDDEMAKLHIRYMIGGQASGVTNEELFRFEFPEKPGALLRFLNQFGDRFNVSMFHYRNHGAAEARILVGLQIDPEQRDEARKAMDELGYPYWEESDNQAYKLFLR
ncbi:threonine ammonia-lyase, biosynthetic [Pokkaliibacter sp. CJK22405]|uniref:threonine ammonia-lyase, biosynthetic n=1 Tax=Pokkaliibacter sp. CJK22405 TaxID=3384615 RepID=UPI003984E15E